MEFAEGVDGLFEREYAPLVRSLSVAFDPESAADAVQEAFIAADRRWSRVGGYDDSAADDIATALDVSAGTMKSNLHDARLKLRSLLQEDAHD
jgi:DNA-directed RNA polymerase specialized sigma24 family protein